MTVLAGTGTNTHPLRLARVDFSSQLKGLLMARRPKPWYRKARRSWFVTISGVQHNLGPDKAEAYDRFHQLMRQPQTQKVSAESLPAIADECLCATLLWKQFAGDSQKEWLSTVLLPRLDGFSDDLCREQFIHFTGISSRVVRHPISVGRNSFHSNSCEHSHLNRFQKSRSGTCHTDTCVP